MLPIGLEGGDAPGAERLRRLEVRVLRETRRVVVVTNDQRIVRDVRAMGANTISSDQLLALMR